MSLKSNQWISKVLKKRLEEYNPIGVKKVYVVRKKDVISFNKTKYCCRNDNINPNQ